MTSAAQCMYLNTVWKLFKGGLRGVNLSLPSPILLQSSSARVQLREAADPDNRVLILPLTHDMPSLEEICLMSERVGGMLNDVPIELGARAVEVREGDLHIPFFALEAAYPIGLLAECRLKVEII